MIRSLRLHYDRFLLVLALVGLGAGLEWVRRLQPDFAAMRVERVQLILSGAAFELPGQPLPTVIPSWPAPMALVQRGGWPGEVFTPPILHLDAGRRSFTPAPPERARGLPAAKPAPFELLAVKPDFYRVQLSGYFGPEDDRLVAFTDLRSADILLARVGQSIAGQDAVCKAFEVRQALAAASEAGPVYEAVARATLYDERSGKEVVLESQSRRMADTPVAVFRLTGQGMGSCELRVGDSFAEESFVYRVERIQLEPAEVWLNCATPGQSVPELRIVRPRQGETEGGAEPPPAAPPEAGRVAIDSR